MGEITMVFSPPFTSSGMILYGLLLGSPHDLVRTTAIQGIRRLMDSCQCLNHQTSQAATDTRMEAFRETWDDRREPVPGKSEVQNASETCKAWWFQRYIV